MYKWINPLNWFKKKELEPNNIVAYISFTALMDGNISIETKWAKSDAPHAVVLGQLLFLVNEGGLSKDIGLLLQQYLEQDKESEEFIIAAISEWVRLHQEKEKQEEKIKQKQKEDEDEPLISPDQYMNLPVSKESDDE